MAETRKYGIAGFVVLFTGGHVASVVADPVFLPSYVPASPAGDAADLARLAPPSRPSTARATYGDAGFARGSHAARRHDRGFVCIELASPRDRCPPSTRLHISNSYVVTPAYVSAPQIVGAAPGHPSPLRSPFVDFVFGAYDEANSLLPTAP